MIKFPNILYSVYHLNQFQMKMRRPSFIFKSDRIYYIVFAFLLSCFLNCNGDHAQSRKNRSVIPQAQKMKANQAEVFLTYIDCVLKLPDTKFNEAGIRSLNKSFLNKLPLMIHDPTKEDNGKNIIIQYYKNNEGYDKIGSEIILLIPETITDSLTVADFTGCFGSIKNEKPLIGVTAQPLPVHIQVSPDRAVKLTFKNNENRDQAVVTTVEVLNYR